MCLQPAILRPSVNFLLLTPHWTSLEAALADKGTWYLLPTTPAMLPTATKHFDRAAQYVINHFPLLLMLASHDQTLKYMYFLLFPLQVTKLCDLAADGDSVTSVSWSERVCEYYNAIMIIIIFVCILHHIITLHIHLIQRRLLWALAIGHWQLGIAKVLFGDHSSKAFHCFRMPKK